MEQQQLDQQKAEKSGEATPRSGRRRRPKARVDKAIMTKRRKAFEGMEKRREQRQKSDRAAAERILEEYKKRKQAAKDAKPVTIDMFNVLNTVAANQHRTLPAWGITGVTHSFQRTPAFFAATDFSQIIVQWPNEWIGQNRFDQEALSHQVALVKGVMQHEIGHLRFTRPWTEVGTDVERAFNSGKLSKEDDTFYSDIMLGTLHSTLHRVWNLLEDQRMESLVVEKVPRMARYFGVMLSDIVLGTDDMSASWVWLAGRTYLPNRILRKSFKLFGDDVKATTWNDLMNAYKAASSSWEIWKATVDAALFLKNENLLDGVQSYELDAHHDFASDGDASSNPFLSDEQMKEHGRKGQSIDALMEDDAADDDGGGTSLKDDIDNLKKQAINDTKKDVEVREATQQANRKAGRQAGSLGEASSSGALSQESQRRAILVASGIEDALNSFLTEQAPRWVTNQEVGVLDAIRYRTRQAGSREYRRFLSGASEDGLDVHVSMLCDQSGSMHGNMTALSEAMYATGIACQNLGIDSTFVLWSSAGYGPWKIWEDRIEPTLYGAAGGTDPTEALNDLHTHNTGDASKHLVLIFTDGAWYGTPSLKTWSESGRTIVLVRYGNYDGNFQNDLGADAHVPISDISQLPAELTRALIGVLNKD